MFINCRIIMPGEDEKVVHENNDDDDVDDDNDDDRSRVERVRGA